MTRRQPLSPTQQRAVERLARGQSCTCIECGSAEYLESADTAIRAANYINVGLYCQNPRAEHPLGVLALGKSFPLTFEQARNIGLHTPPDEPPPQP